MLKSLIKKYFEEEIRAAVREAVKAEVDLMDFAVETVLHERTRVAVAHIVSRPEMVELIVTQLNRYSVNKS